MSDERKSIVVAASKELECYFEEIIRVHGLNSDEALRVLAAVRAAYNTRLLDEATC